MQTVVYDRWYLAEKTPRPARRPTANTGRVLDHREACPRRALAAAIGRTGDSYAALSRMLDRPDYYLRRFVVDGHPRALREDEHRRLASFFGVDQRSLGVRELWVGRD